MKSTLLLICLLLVPVSGWGGEPHYKAWRDGGPSPWEYETHFIIPRHMEDNVVFNVQGASSGEIRIEHWIKGAEPCGGNSKPYQIRTIPADECNEFLKEHPEWEPFGVEAEERREKARVITTGASCYVLPKRLVDTPIIYLRRRVED